MRLMRQRSRGSTGGGNVDDASSPQFQEQVETLIPAEIRMISGCHSEQTSADLANATSNALPNPAGRAGGACTSALLELLYNHHKQADGNNILTFQSLLLKLRNSLRNEKGLEQIPQLSSSRPLELQQTPFSLTDGPGQRRALLVGINYRGQSGELSGCHNDVINVKNYLMRHHRYSEDQILILMDNGNPQRNIYPTRQKIILGLQQMVAHSQPGDNVYFHYSGHGGLLSPMDDGMGGFFNAFKMGRNRGNGEHGPFGGTKTYDETLYPVDHERAGQIRDFSLFHHFVRPLKQGVTATCVLDCCHSGTVLDLPYQYQPTDANTIRTARSMDSLGNLAFLYLLAGNPMAGLGDGFAPVWNHVDQSLPEGTTVDEYQGTGMEELLEVDQMDDTAFVSSPDLQDYFNAEDVGLEDDHTDDAVRGFDDPSAAVDANNAVFVGPDGEDPVMVVQGHAVEFDPANEDYLQPPLVDDTARGFMDNPYDTQFATGDGDNDNNEGLDCCPDDAGCGDMLGALMDAATDD